VKACEWCKKVFAPRVKRRRCCGNTCAAFASQDARRRGRDVAAEFWERAIPEPNTGCFLWMGDTNPAGYGVARFGLKHRTPAHRRAYQLAVGAVPDGMDVCHRCDNPPCVNPAHLFLGPRVGNLAEMVRKGRSARGEKHRAAVMTADEVRQMRALAAGGEPVAEIAQRFNRNESTVRSAVRGKSWRHIQ
jgi:DNA-binding CsgD family transcriptional regulator